MSAFADIQPKLNERQKEVLAVYNFGDFTDKEVAEKLGKPINEVCNRIGELIRRKSLPRLEPYTDKLQDGRKARVCRIISN